MKKIQSKKNYTLVLSDKSQILGKLIYAPDTFEDYIEVKDTELEEIQKAIDEQQQERLQTDN